MTQSVISNQVKKISSKVPFAAAWLKNKDRKEYYYFEGTSTIDWNGQTLENDECVVVSLEPQELKEIQDMLANNPDELPLYELIENNGSEVLKKKLLTVEHEDGIWSFSPTKLESFTPTYAYRFSVHIFHEETEKNLDCVVAVPLSDHEYATLLACYETIPNLTFNRLEAYLPELHASITESIALRTDIPAYNHPFCVGFDELVEDHNAIYRLFKEDEFAEIPRASFLEDVLLEQAEEYIEGKYSIDSFVLAMHDDSQPELDTFHRQILEQESLMVQQGKKSTKEAVQSIFEAFSII